MTEMSAPRCVLFDAVGTLIYADPPVAEAYRVVGERHGARLSSDVIAERFRAAFARTMNDDGIASAPRERRRWEQVVGDVFREWPNATGNLLDELWQHFSTAAAWRLFDDAAPVLNELRRRGCLVGVASNFDERLVSVCRGHAALTELELFWSSDIGYSKPHPLFFARVAQRLGLSPREILLVGDDWTADFQGALAAGWQAIHIDRAAEEGQPLAACRSLGEVPARIRWG